MHIVRDQEKMGTKMAILQGHIDILALCRMQTYALLRKIAMCVQCWIYSVNCSHMKEAMASRLLMM